MVLSIPASHSIDLIKKYMIYAYPHPRTYNIDSYVTFRKKGGAMENLYTVHNTVLFNPITNNMKEAVKHLSKEEQERITGYVEERKNGIGFPKSDQPFIFWILKLEKPLSHEPRPERNYLNFVYFTYEELTAGKQIVSIASKK